MGAGLGTGFAGMSAKIIIRFRQSKSRCNINDLQE